MKKFIKLFSLVLMLMLLFLLRIVPISAQTIHKSSIPGQNQQISQQFFSPKLAQDGQTVNFMGCTWFVIKDLQNGNYMIVPECSSDDPIPTNLGKSTFAKTGQITYFDNDNDTDGYRGSSVEEMINNWYNKNIKDSVYEAYVQPVLIPNPTRQDCSWSSFDSSKFPNSQMWHAVTCSPQYATSINKTYGIKQAFLLSAADITENTGPWIGVLQSPANTYINILNNDKHIRGDLWLRSPGNNCHQAMSFGQLLPYAFGDNVDWGDNIIIPSLVIHI